MVRECCSDYWHEKETKQEQGNWETLTAVWMRDDGSLIQDDSRGSDEKQLDFECILQVKSDNVV